MSPEAARAVEEVLERSDAGHPADAEIRIAVKAARLEGADARDVSAAVFAYHRWLAWLRPNEPVSSRARHALELSAAFAERPASFADDLLVRRVVPDWVSSALEVSAPWARALQTEPRLWLRARRGQGAALGKRLGSARGPLPDSLWYPGDSDLFLLPEFHEGLFEIQDIASQAVGWACDPKPGETWWDACAGEGGKTLHLSSLMGNRGLIWATDRAAWRLEKLRRRAGRAGVFNYRSRQWTGPGPLPTRTRFDGVLVDAPCSGTGTWQRNPHARWTTTLKDVLELAELQKQLLTAVAGAVKPGGRLIYAVCTLTRQETVEVAATFESMCAGFERLPLTNPLAPAGAEPALFLRPEETRGNGMFIAQWRRVAAGEAEVAPPVT